MAVNMFDGISIKNVTFRTGFTQARWTGHRVWRLKMSRMRHLAAEPACQGSPSHTCPVWWKLPDHIPTYLAACTNTEYGRTNGSSVWPNKMGIPVPRRYFCFVVRYNTYVDEITVTSWGIICDALWRTNHQVLKKKTVRTMARKREKLQVHYVLFSSAIESNWHFVCEKLFLDNTL